MDRFIVRKRKWWKQYYNSRKVLLLVLCLSLSGYAYTSGEAGANPPAANHALPDMAAADKISEQSVEQSMNQDKVELIDQRTASSKTFTLKDGLFETVLANEEIHYKDEEGKFQDNNLQLLSELNLTDSDINSKRLSIESSQEIKALYKSRTKVEKEKLKDSGDFNFRSPKVPYYLKISNKFKNGYTIGKGTDRLTIIPIGLASDAGNAVKPIAADHASHLYNDPNHVLIYKNAWKDTDVLLESQNSGLKESIVLRTPDAPTQFRFEVIGKIGNDLRQGELQIMPAWLIDANGKIRDVSQELVVENGKQLLLMKADVSGLQYPVVIDPTISSTSLTRYSWEKRSPTYLPTGTATGISGGRVESSGSYIETQSFIRWYTSSLPSDAVVTSASLELNISSSYFTNKNSISAGWFNEAYAPSNWNDNPNANAFNHRQVTPYNPYGGYTTSFNGVKWIPLSNANIYARGGNITLSLFFVPGTPYGSNYINYSSANLHLTYTIPSITLSKPVVTGTVGVNEWSMQGTGYINLSWNEVAGATGYYLHLFNGYVYERIPVSNFTSWTSKGKFIFPKLQLVESWIDGSQDKVFNENYTTNPNNNYGELWDNPRYLYRKTRRTSMTDDGSRSYKVKISAFNATGESLPSDPIALTLENRTLPHTRYYYDKNGRLDYMIVLPSYTEYDAIYDDNGNLISKIKKQ
ncbi:hypothetical protein AB4Z29_31115 [Paenibacillus sp. 2TAB23]|uniref:hypothetical protein n=1 Tax=Paenibacillus sp. 2TAB23 TaxID=3233004 RepID=UPI003F95D20B